MSSAGGMKPFDEDISDRLRPRRDTQVRMFKGSWGGVEAAACRNGLFPVLMGCASHNRIAEPRRRLPESPRMTI